MDIVLSKNVIVKLDNYVQHMKNVVGLSKDELGQDAHAMVTSISNTMQQGIGNALNSRTSKDQLTYKGYVWYKSKNVSHYWVFDYIVFYNQQLAIIYSFRAVKNVVQEHEEIKRILSLMERICI